MIQNSPWKAFGKVPFTEQAFHKCQLFLRTWRAFSFILLTVHCIPDCSDEGTMAHWVDSEDSRHTCDESDDCMLVRRARGLDFYTPALSLTSVPSLVGDFEKVNFSEPPFHHL